MQPTFLGVLVRCSQDTVTALVFQRVSVCTSSGQCVYDCVRTRTRVCACVRVRVRVRVRVSAPMFFSGHRVLWAFCPEF